MKFSVVTILYNQGAFLRAAIDSVIGQRAPGIEVQYIVCDPGSTDDSRAIIEGYGSAIDVVLLERDAGPADGLNRGFAHADGEIFCYINSDDYFLPGAFAAVAAEFARSAGTDVLTGHGLAVDAQGDTLRRVWSEPFSRRSSAYGAHIQIQPSTFIRAESFRKSGGFEVADRANWDGGLVASLFLSGARIAVIDAFLSAYRLHDTSITQTGKLADAHSRSAHARAVRLLGREPTAADRAIAGGYRILKHLRWPGRTLERLRKGPLFGRQE